MREGGCVSQREGGREDGKNRRETERDKTGGRKEGEGVSE